METDIEVPVAATKHKASPSKPPPKEFGAKMELDVLQLAQKKEMHKRFMTKTSVHCMNAVEKDNRELAEISIVLSPFSPTQHQSSTATVVESTAAAITTTTSPVSVQTPITGNLISIPVHLATSRMVCLRATTQLSSKRFHNP
ncbi:hypothetical protein ACTXT7_004186 [Hymenolepis weldensis]